MVEIEYKKVKLNVIFNNKRGNSKYTKKYCSENKGEYEVYTGTTIGSFDFIDTYDYEGELLTYTTDGENAGTINVLKGKFNVGGHRAILFPKHEKLSNMYFKYKLQNVFFDNVKKGDVPSITWSRIKDIVVSVPIDKNGNYNLEKQLEIVRKYEIVENKKREIKEKLDYINEVQVDFMVGKVLKTESLKIEEIFDLSITSNSSKFTKTFIRNNKGNIPVYGASKESDIPSYGYVADNATIIENKNGVKKTKVKYFNDCLSYNIDGLAGYVFYREGRFSLSEKVRPLIIRDEFKDSLNPIFLKYIIEPVFRRNIKGRLAENGKNEYTKLNVRMIEELSISIPIKDDGCFDLEKQNEIVNKYKTIEEIKHKITQKILPFTSAKLQFNEETPYIYVHGLEDNEGFLNVL